MNHLEAQSYIMPFIDGKIPVKKQSDFVLHMCNCKKCHEELEIYYTLMVGMRQLDNNQELSTDFNRDLENELNKLKVKANNKKRLSLSLFSIVFIFMIMIGAISYTGGLARVYLFEQNTKKEQQGQYYFRDSLKDKLCIETIDRVYSSEQIQKADVISDFDRIRAYNRMKNDMNKILEIGEELRNAEVTTD